MLANQLKYGDTIGVVGVANSLELNNRQDEFFRAEKLLTQKGFKIKKGKYVLEDYYGSAGTKEQRAQDMMEMFCDKEVKAIICLLGGQTCNTFIDLLDYEVIKQNPKIIVGYSDVTVLLQAIYKKTGLVTFSGPNFVSLGNKQEEDGYIDFEKVLVHKEMGKFQTGKKKFLRKGNVQGKIIGTNLGSMMYLLGTKYFPDMQDKILLIESYRTSLNECQRRMAHLKQYGVFDKVKAVVVGYNYDLQKDGNTYPGMEDILLDYTKEYDFPIVKCNDFGHKIANAVIPIGVEAKIDSDKETIEIVESFLK